MVKKYLKKCLLSLKITEMQIKTTLRFHLSLVSRHQHQALGWGDLSLIAGLTNTGTSVENSRKAKNKPQSTTLPSYTIP